MQEKLPDSSKTRLLGLPCPGNLMISEIIKKILLLLGFVSDRRGKIWCLLHRFQKTGRRCSLLPVVLVPVLVGDVPRTV